MEATRVGCALQTEAPNECSQYYYNYLRPGKGSWGEDAPVLLLAFFEMQSSSLHKIFRSEWRGGVGQRGQERNKGFQGRARPIRVSASPPSPCSISVPRLYPLPWVPPTMPSEQPASSQNLIEDGVLLCRKQVGSMQIYHTPESPRDGSPCPSPPTLLLVSLWGTDCPQSQSRVQERCSLASSGSLEEKGS